MQRRGWEVAGTVLDACCSTALRPRPGQAGEVLERGGGGESAVGRFGNP